MDYTFRLADTHDLLPVYHLMVEVLNLMEEKTWFVPETQDSLREVLEENKGFLLLAIHEPSQSIAGYFMILFPGINEKNLGCQLQFTEEQLALSCHMESTVVHPLHRGHHLQTRMALKAQEYLSQQPYRYAFATVHPDNQYSLESMLRSGYQVVKEAKLYGGLDRLILKKDLNNEN